jgi:hypothetical protein
MKWENCKFLIYTQYEQTRHIQYNLLAFSPISPSIRQIKILERGLGLHYLPKPLERS